jgi:hypothetical protein
MGYVQVSMGFVIDTLCHCLSLLILRPNIEDTSRLVWERLVQSYTYCVGRDNDEHHKFRQVLELFLRWYIWGVGGR